MNKKETTARAWEQLVEALDKDQGALAQSALRMGACAWISPMEFGKLRLKPGMSIALMNGDAVSVSMLRGASIVFETLTQSVFKEGAECAVPKEVARQWMHTACMEGRLPMAKKLLADGAPAPDLKAVFDLLDKLRRQKGKRAFQKSGSKWRPLPGEDMNTTWGALLAPVFDWAVEFVPASSREAGSRHGVTLLMRAGDGANAKKLLAQGADPWARDDRNMGALEYALNSGERGWVEAVAASGIDLAQAVDWGRKSGLNTATEWAVAAAAANIAQACAPCASIPGPTRRL